MQTQKNFQKETTKKNVIDSLIHAWKDHWLKKHQTRHAQKLSKTAHLWQHKHQKMACRVNWSDFIKTFHQLSA